jgi:soluble lytic murein transglycosylase-like protein
VSIDFIQQRLAHLDNYLSGIDQKIKDKVGSNKDSVASNGAIKFDSILNSVLEPNDSNKKVNATIKKDDLSKLPDNFENFIDTVSKEVSDKYKVEVNPSLIRSVMKQESGFNPNAKSHAGAEGLMQLMPATAKEVGVFNSFNPYQNLRGGATYLAQMLHKFDGNLSKALAAYNAGPKAVEKYNGIPPYTETQNYVQSIMKDYLSRENYRPIDMVG